MSDALLIHLLPSLSIAAYQRMENGTFQPLGPPPVWFRRMARDDTFPFLGHILEEACMFWQRGTPGLSEFGPCVEVDDDGVEFHYKVLAISADDIEYLVFQLDPGADQMRQLLQRVRSKTLASERNRALHEALATALRTTHQDIKALLTTLVRSELTPEQRELLNALTAKCVDQIGSVQRLILTTALS